MKCKLFENNQWKMKNMKNRKTSDTNVERFEENTHVHIHDR